MCRYILFEVPANLALRKFRPSLFFPAIMLGWGIVPPPVSVSLIVDHDSHGNCYQPYRIGHLSRIPWYDGSGIFPWCLILLDTLVILSRATFVDSQVPPIGTCFPHCYFLFHGYLCWCIRWLTGVRNRIHEEHRRFQERMALDFHPGYLTSYIYETDNLEGILTCVVSALAPFFIRDVTSIPR